MNAINQVIIEGNVTRDSSVKETAKGTRVATMPIAVNRTYKDTAGGYQNEVSYFEVQAWGQKFCENIAKNGVKGRGVRVVGRIKQDHWKTDDGKYKEKYYIVAEHVEFKPGKKDQPAVSANAQNELNNAAEAAAGLAMESEAGISVSDTTAEFTVHTVKQTEEAVF